MNLDQFKNLCAYKRPTAIVLNLDDLHQLQREALPTDVIRTHYMGAPILTTDFARSYVLEDTPDGPLIHMIL